MKLFEMKQIGKLDFFIFMMCYCILFVDSINGFFLNRGITFPISVIYKFVLLSLVSCRLLCFKSKLIWFYLFYFSALGFLNILYDLGTFSQTSSFFFRFVMILIFYEYLFRMHKVYNITPYVYKVIQCNFLVCILNIFLGLLGFGETAYEEGAGFKGFFYAANEVSGIMLTLFPIVLFVYGKKWINGKKKYILFAITLFVSAVLLGTKTAIIGVFLIICYVSKRLSYRLHKYAKILLFPIGIILLYFICYYFVTYSLVYERFIFFYAQNGWMALLSGRDSFFLDSMKVYGNSSCMLQLFGLGVPEKTIEIDFFDFLYILGSFGTSLLLLFWLKLFWVLRKNRSDIASVVCFSNWLLIIVSFFGGHIFSSAMCGVFIAFMNIIPLLITKQTIYDKSFQVK